MNPTISISWKSSFRRDIHIYLYTFLHTAKVEESLTEVLDPHSPEFFLLHVRKKGYWDWELALEIAGSGAEKFGAIFLDCFAVVEGWPYSIEPETHGNAIVSVDERLNSATIDL